MDCVEKQRAQVDVGERSCNGRARVGEQKCRRGAAADVGVATGELLVHPDGIARPDW